MTVVPNSHPKSPTPRGDDWVPGDVGYIRNLDPKPKEGLEGWNRIFKGGAFSVVEKLIGEPRWWAHGGGVRSLLDFYTEALQWSRGHGAEVAPARASPDPKRF